MTCAADLFGSVTHVKEILISMVFYLVEKKVEKKKPQEMHAC